MFCMKIEGNSLPLHGEKSKPTPWCEVMSYSVLGEEGVCKEAQGLMAGILWAEGPPLWDSGVVGAGDGAQ